jgi:2-polyprenyl-3-methyl-5-hydroxy-6-metoxy-1,4-benzoquinol methylase
MANAPQEIGGAQSASSSDLYQGYESWKGWSKPFTYTTEDAAYFAGESSDAKIEGGDVLEIGFGGGSFLAWAHERKARVAGTEINPALLSAARDFGLDLLPADFESVADRHASRFDTIIAFDVFEHFDLQTIVARVKAAETMLKLGGHLILRFPNAQSPFGLAPQNGDPTHRSALSKSAFEQLIQGTSFVVVRYGPSYRIGTGRLAKRLVRRIRYMARDLVAALLNAIYAQAIPWDPVVVLVLRKKY